MPTSDFSTSGTIKVKNADGVLVPFHPKTKTDCILDVESDRTLTAVISELEESAEAAANSGGVKVVYEIDDEALEEFGGNQSTESMTVAVMEEIWEYSVSVTEYNKTTGIPFNLYGTDSSLEVSWGDGTTSILTAESFPDGSVLNALHTYDTAGIYNISISCEDWSEAYYFTNAHHKDGNSSYYSSDLLNAYSSNIYYFRETLYSLNNAFPHVKGVKMYSKELPSSYSDTLTSSGTDFSYMFVHCKYLTSISERLFSRNPGIESFRYCFWSCSRLQSIPENLFKRNTAATNFSCCFAVYNGGITKLTEIPANLFKYNTEAVNFDSCFYGCDISTIPADLFKHNVKAESFDGCFMSIDTLLSIPADLFKYNTQATDFSRCFDNCVRLTTIPEHLFDYNTEAVNFNGCFEACGIASIPPTLFANCTKAVDFSSCFNGNEVQSIPEGLFANCPDALYFNACFCGSYNLAEIPENLFKYNVKATHFSSCFLNSSITSIPENLFKYNVQAINFASCFSECTQLSEIPEHLFDACPLATDFARCFGGSSYGDSVMTYASIPENLFKYNTAATNFKECFQYSSIASIPENLFKYNTAATNYEYCFYNCLSLNNFSVHITSRWVSGCGSFVKQKSNASRTVYVPSSSSTQTKFNAVASALGLTIIGE